MDDKRVEDPIRAMALPTYGTEPVQVAIDEGNVIQEDELLILNDVHDDLSPQFRDIPFAMLFLVQLAFVLWLGFGVAPAGFHSIQLNYTEIKTAIENASDDITSNEKVNIEELEEFAALAASYLKLYPKRILVFEVIPCAVIAFIFSFLVTAVVIKPCPKPIIYTFLAGSLGITIVLMLTMAISTNEPFGYFMSILTIACVTYFISLAWPQVPFGAINLKAALEGVSRNCGLYLVACALAELGLLWLVYWLYILVGTMAYLVTSCQKQHPEINFSISEMDNSDSDICSPSFSVVFGLYMSFYWTSSVIMNTVQVTVAGAVATWCFDKQSANHCCSSAVWESLYRSLTYSLGSISFGSLLQAFACFLRGIVESARSRRQEDSDGCGTLLVCILDCLTRWLDDVLKYFNQFAYVYVGIYGYSYLESGRRVYELIQARGWTTIVSNSLVSYILAITNIVVAAFTGLAAVAIERVVTLHRGHLDDADGASFVFGPLPGWEYWAFGLGFLTGFWVSSIMLNVVRGAVNTVIICWADSPASMKMNHPALTKEMAEAWQAVFPDANAVSHYAYTAIPAQIF